MQKNIDVLVRKAQSGEFGPKAEKLVDSVTNAWRTRDVVHETVAGFHASLSRRLGYGVLFGVVIQIYVISRVKTGQDPAFRDPKSAILNPQSL